MKDRAQRRAEEFARTYGSPERVLEVRRMPCSVPGCQWGPSENCHVVNGGMGRKADYRFIVPLCPHHHRELHTQGMQTFERKHDLNLLNIAANTSRWLDEPVPEGME